jgi:hypothetical protein
MVACLLALVGTPDDRRPAADVPAPVQGDDRRGVVNEMRQPEEGTMNGGRVINLTLRIG